ncbi:MAG TPA: hypothetical protein VKA89_10900 [Solirubrobacterales bacterium]|nr:hypothetical protein [Solirubrobacterales bacterium]
MQDLPDTAQGSDPAGSPDEVARVRELERFAIARLPTMQLADGLFCHEVAVENGCRPAGRSLRYTLIVLIGLLRAEDAGVDHRFHLGALRSRVLSELDSDGLTPGDFGLALWAEARMDGSAADELVAGLARRLSGPSGLEALISTEVAWIALGLSESEAWGETGEGERILSGAREQLVVKRRTESGLLLHSSRGPRRRFPNFATQIYGILALSYLARARGDDEALQVAREAGDRLLALQMPDGAWPWIFDAQRGTIVEPYEIYSVHQDSMAPMGLGALTHVTGDLRYRSAAVYGLGWIFGRNDLGAEMLDRETGMLYRSIRRRERLDRAYLYGRTAASYLKPPRVKDARRMLEVNRTDRPYHLGWVLEAWAGREHLAALET